MKIRSTWVVVALALAGVVFRTETAAAQSQITTGTIQGRITDESGGVIPGASVTLTHTATGVARTIVTDEQGRFTAPLLEVGDYEIAVEASGFGKVVRKGYTLALGQTLVVTIPVKIAGLEQVVTVSDESPLIEVSKSETSTLVDQRAVSNLPLNGRRFLDLAFLTPGVSQEGERRQVSLAGQRGINSNINVDGADFNQPFFGGQRGGERTSDAYVVSQEAIREFQVVRSGFAPEFGRSTGGVVNVITKSGTNLWHGTGFYYLRHREFAPRTVFGDDTAPTRQQFGGTLGGPLNRDKSFFFMAYDQQAQHQALVVRFNNPEGLPPDILAQQGVFKSTNDVNTYLVKVDHQWSAATHVTARYNYSRNKALNGTFTGVTTGVLENNGTERDRTHTGVLNINTVISASALNELRGQYSYEDRPRINNGEELDFNSQVGPQVQVGTSAFLGGVSFLPVQQNDDRFQIADNFSLIRGGHNIKFGFDWNRSHVEQAFRGNWRGVYVFTNVANFVSVLNQTPDAVADQFRVFFGSGQWDVAVYEIAGFFQDSWKVNRRLTLTMGLRYEATINPQPDFPNPLLPQTGQIPSDTKQWQPRLGLSWDISGTGRTLFRASSGLFYARTPMLLLNQAFNANGDPDVGSAFTLVPAQIRQAQSVHPEFVFPFVPDTSSATDASYFTEAGIAGLRPDASFFEPNFRNPRSFNVTAGIEQLLSPNLALSLDWVHSNTVYLERIRDTNLAPPVLTADGSNPSVLRYRFISARPNPNFNILRSQESSARSNYDALSLMLNKRFASRYQFLGSYTLAYNRDDDSNERNFAGITYENAFNLLDEYRWSRNDIRHRGVLSGSYEIPKGFLVSGIATYRSGLPFTPFTGVDSNGDAQFTDRPIIAGIPLLRNSFRQPNYFTIDMRVSKSFRIKENHTLELLFDMFNLTNQRNFTYNVSTNESTTTASGSRWGTGQTPLATFRTLTNPDGTYNRSTANVAAPFQLQVALRYSF